MFGSCWRDKELSPPLFMGNMPFDYQQPSTHFLQNTHTHTIINIITKRIPNKRVSDYPLPPSKDTDNLINGEKGDGYSFRTKESV